MNVIFRIGAVMAACFLLCHAAVGADDDARRSEKTRVLILTGLDYPGHLWRLTAPVLAKGIGQDARLKVDIQDDPAFLASPDIHQYQAIVLHYMNWEKPDPGEKARENLKKFVADGKGLVLVHFACGAFKDWPEFKEIAGRVYDPKLRGHDPRGPFRVEIVNNEHPITKGLKSFDTDDELYTCVTGDRKIDLLATAKSKVDGKDYPQAWANSYGKGRVFHCLLGHDVKALEVPAVAELFRRGTAWSAGLEPR